MTVTVVADVLGKENNGTTIACLNLVRYLRGRGDEVRVLCADEDRRGQALRERVYAAMTERAKLSDCEYIRYRPIEEKGTARD